MTEGICLSIGEIMKAIQPQSSYKFLGMFEADGIKCNGMKEKTRECMWQVRKLLAS